MNRIQKRASIVVASVSIMSLALACVTANASPSNTPLYTFRMEEASSENSFLPTAVNEFTYNTKNEYTLSWGLVTDGSFPFSRPGGVFELWYPTQYWREHTCSKYDSTCWGLTCDIITCSCTCHYWILCMDSMGTFCWPDWR